MPVDVCTGQSVWVHDPERGRVPGRVVLTTPTDLCVEWVGSAGWVWTISRLVADQHLSPRGE